MKKGLFLLLVLGMVFLIGCELPVNKDASDTSNAYTEEGGDQWGNEAYNGDPHGTEDESAGQVKGVSTEAAGKDDLEKPKLSITLYYQNGNGYMVPATRKVSKQEGIAKAAISGLIDSSINREELEYFDLYPVLPQGTEVRGLTIKDGTATIDFNGRLLEYENKISERNIISSIVYTLTEFKTIHNVKILIDGSEKGVLKYGADLSQSLNRENVLANSESLKLKQGMKKVDIYLLASAENQYSYTLPVSVEYSEKVNKGLAAIIVENLAKASKNKNLYSEVPQKAELLESKVDGKTLFLNFGDGIKDYGGGTAREEGLMKQILYSMKQIEGVEKVRILIDGSEDTLPEGTDISSEINLPVVINDYID